MSAPLPRRRPFQSTLTAIWAGSNYAVQAGERGPIKIGYTTMTVEARINNLQQASPYLLRSLGQWHAEPEHERQAHILLTPYRLRSEWYHPVQPVLDFIAQAIRESEEREPDRVMRYRTLMNEYAKGAPQ